MATNKSGTEVGISVGDSLSIVVTDEATGATATLTLTADGMFMPEVPPDTGEPPEPEPPPGDEGAARWLAPLEATVSTKETGPIVALTAWGGREFGHSSRYTLGDDAPSGVTIDADTGVLSLARAVTSAGAHGFLVHVANRQGGEAASFGFVLNVDDSIVHKTYRPEDFGGNLTNMQSRILSDQNAAGDGKLRARVEFTKGKTYTYTDNHFLTGVQFYECVAVGSGANPKLKNTHDASGHVYDQGPLRLGLGANCCAEIGDENIKNRMALIADAEAGDDTVTMLAAGDGGRLRPGMWHAVISYSTQIGMYPPNCRYTDFVKVVSVDDTRVTLDRPLNHSHQGDRWEDPNDKQSLGRARIGPWELADGKTRATERGVWRDIEFLMSPNYNVTYAESHIHLFMIGCKLPHFVPSMNKYVEMRNCTISGNTGPRDTAGAGEPDKLSEVLVYDGCDIQGYTGGASGYDLFLTRNSKLYPVHLGPRQFRDIGSTFDAHQDTYYCVPYCAGGHGPQYDEFHGTKFAATGNPPQWMWSSAPIEPLTLSGSSWQGNKLIIPRSFASFEQWLWWLYEGGMLFTGASVDKPGAYGRVDKVYAPADGSALWADVTWISGTKPTSGKLNIPQKGLHKLIWGQGTTITAGDWADPSYISIEGTPGDRPFPEGIS